MHRTKSYYTGLAIKYYRCYKVHIEKTLAKRIADTVAFLPYNITIPPITTKEAVLSRIKDLIKLLRGSKSHYSLIQYNNDTLTAIE